MIRIGLRGLLALFLFVVLAGVAAAQPSSEVCCTPISNPSVNTQGFWKHICDHPGHPSGEHDNLPLYIDAINDFATFADVADASDLCDVMHPTPPDMKCKQAEAQFMALLLNVVSGRIAECNCIDDPDLGPTTVGNALNFIDALLSDPNRTVADCVLAQRIAAGINQNDSPVDEEQCTTLEPVCGGDGLIVNLPYSETVDVAFSGEVIVRAFDVDDATCVRIETLSDEPLSDDTILSLFVGPDDNGDCFFTGISDDDSGAGLLSKIIFLLPPADDLLGNTTGDANYVVQLTTRGSADCFELVIEEVDCPVLETETEPNDAESTANAIAIGDTIAGDINPACDYDTFSFSVSEDTLVSIEQNLAGAGTFDDGAIQVTDCSGSVLNGGCDDNSGPGFLSLISGCLPAGTYCAQLRAFDGNVTGDYQLVFSGTPGCSANTQPNMDGDGLGTCMDFDTCP